MAIGCEVGMGGPLTGIVCLCDDRARITGVGVYDHDPGRTKVGGLALEDDPLSIRRPLRIIVLGQALGGMGDLADVASVRVHREESAFGLLGIEVAPKDYLTVPASTTVGALVVVVLVIVLATGENRQSHGHHH
jgi:hypothetical protein